MIHIKNISKSFGEKKVFDNFSGNVEENEFVCITGKSGSGKTTLLNMIGFLEHPDQGEIEINGLKGINKKEKMHIRRKTIGYVFQNYALIEDDTVEKNLQISSMYSPDFNKEKANQTLERVGLSKSILKKQVYQLSGGEKQRVALARVMLKPFDVLLADEPTGNLDDENKNAVIDILLSLKEEGKTIVCVTHDHDLANVADRIINIDELIYSI